MHTYNKSRDRLRMQQELRHYRGLHALDKERVSAGVGARWFVGQIEKLGEETVVVTQG